MTTYQAYWGHDPVFDSTQTIAALPDVPCPEIDEQTLLGMAQFAIKTNFGKPKPRSIKPEFDVAGHLEDLLQRRQTVTQRSRDEHWLGLQVDGPGGGQWKLLLERGRPIAAERGLSPKCSATFLARFLHVPATCPAAASGGTRFGDRATGDRRQRPVDAGVCRGHGGGRGRHSPGLSLGRLTHAFLSSLDRFRRVHAAG